MNRTGTVTVTEIKEAKPMYDVKVGSALLDIYCQDPDEQKEILRKLGSDREPEGTTEIVEVVALAVALGQIVLDLERFEFIQAIKRVRELTGLGLKEAKELVDRIKATR